MRTTIQTMGPPQSPNQVSCQRTPNHDSMARLARSYCHGRPCNTICSPHTRRHTKRTAEPSATPCHAPSPDAPHPRVRERSWRTSRTRRAHWARRNHASSRAGTHRPNRPFHGTTPERNPNPNRHPSPCVPHNLHDALNRFFEHHCSIRCFCLMVFRSTHSSSSSSVMSYMICSSFRQMVTSAISSARLCSGSGLPRNRLLTA